VNPVDNELWREIGAMDATMRKRLIANGKRIKMAVESYQHPPEVSIVGGNSRGGGAGAWRVHVGDVLVRMSSSTTQLNIHGGTKATKMYLHNA
jgi:hypothetical protein